MTGEVETEKEVSQRMLEKKMVVLTVSWRGGGSRNEFYSDEALAII